MNLTLFDPTLTTKREQKMNIFSVMSDLNDLILTTKNWKSPQRRSVITEYSRMFQNAVRNLTETKDWQGTFSVEFMERFTELAKEIIAFETKTRPQPEQTKLLQINEFSSLGIVP
jgi:hypothetical protein